jgi:hypothetical protein
MSRRKPTHPNEAGIQHLRTLAEELHSKLDKQPAPLVICVAGAGASTSAGLPNGPALKTELWDAFARAGARAFLDAELQQWFGRGRNDSPEQVFHRLSLFEFATIVTRFVRGQEVLSDCIEKALRKSTHRPLAYELAAHFAKHRYFDHFVVANFDPLLDEAIEDELPERAYFIVSPRDVPIHHEGSTRGEAEDSHNYNDDHCYVVRPFGQLNRRPYSISLEDVSHGFGPGPVDFFLRNYLPHSRANTVRYILILLGYAASEPSFELFLQSLCDAGRQKGVAIYAIDTAAQLAKALMASKRRLSASYDLSLHHIQTDADSAMEILLLLLDNHARNESQHLWVPGARHKLISNCFSYRSIRNVNTGASGASGSGFHILIIFSNRVERSHAPVRLSR